MIVLTQISKREKVLCCCMLSHGSRYGSFRCWSAFQLPYARTFNPTSSIQVMSCGRSRFQSLTPVFQYIERRYQPGGYVTHSLPMTLTVFRPAFAQRLPKRMISQLQSLAALHLNRGPISIIVLDVLRSRPHRIESQRRSIDVSLAFDEPCDSVHLFAIDCHEPAPLSSSENTC